MNVPDFGVSVEFIDNRKPDNGGPLAELSDGIMTNSIPTMVSFLRDLAEKLERKEI